MDKTGFISKSQFLTRYQRFLAFVDNADSDVTYNRLEVEYRFLLNFLKRIYEEYEQKTNKMFQLSIELSKTEEKLNQILNDDEKNEMKERLQVMIKNMEHYVQNESFLNSQVENLKHELKILDDKLHNSKNINFKDAYVGTNDDFLLESADKKDKPRKDSENVQGAKNILIKQQEMYESVINELNRNLNILTSCSKKSQDEVNSLKTCIEKKEKQLFNYDIRLRKERQEKDKIRDEMEKEKKSLQSLLETAQTTVQRNNIERQNFQKKLVFATNEIDDLRDEVQVKNDLIKTKDQELNATLKDLHESCRQLEVFEKHLKTESDQLAAAKQEIKSLHTMVAVLERENKERKTKKTETGGKIKHDLGHQVQVAMQKNVVKFHKKQVAVREGEMKKQEQKMKDIENNLALARKEARQRVKEAADLASELKKQKLLMENQNEKIKNLESKMTPLEKQYSDAQQDLKKMKTMYLAVLRQKNDFEFKYNNLSAMQEMGKSEQFSAHKRPKLRYGS